MSEREAVALAPCPFCGEEAEITAPFLSGKLYRANCVECGAEGGRHLERGWRYE